MNELMESLTAKFSKQFQPKKVFDDIFLGKSLNYEEFKHINYPDYQSIFGNRKLVEVVNDEKYKDADQFVHNNLKVFLNQNISYSIMKKGEGDMSTLSNQNSKSQTKMTNFTPGLSALDLKKSSLETFQNQAQNSLKIERRSSALLDTNK